MKLTGAQIIMECLAREGVEVIFGYPGGANLPMYDTLIQYPKIRHVLVRHEQAAAHAADAYARVTGKAGVCWATSGPGATNLVTGIANAWMDSVPVVAMWKASRRVWAMSSTLRTRALCLVIGIVMPVMSASWKPSRPISQLTTEPVMQTRGTESIQALAMPGTGLVAPGPEVAQQTPALPVTRA